MSIKYPFLAVTVIVLSLGWPGAGFAQGRLGSARIIQCSLQRQSTGSWQKDGTVEATVKPATLTLRFESIDVDSGTAMAKTGAAGVEVTIQTTPGYLHFMQAFRSGPLYTTTVFEAGAAGGRFKAVHSRHEYFTTPLPGATSSPEQYYGECEVVQ